MNNDEIWLYKKGQNGGGTEVVPNPQEEATDELEKVKIGSTVYDIPTGDTLPTVTSSDEGKVLAVNSSGVWAAEELSSGGFTLIENQLVDTGNKWIDGTSPIYAVYLTNGFGYDGYEWPTTIGRLLKAIQFTYNTLGLNEWKSVDVQSNLFCQNNLNGNYRVINGTTGNQAGPLLLFLV